MILNGKIKMLCGSALLAATLMLTTTGCQFFNSKSGSNGPVQAGTNTSALYTMDTIEIGETVRITLSGPIDLPGKYPMEQRVKEDGTINLEYIGSIQAADRKVSELQADIHDRYVPKYYKHLNVLVQYENRFYFINGHVRTPNKYAYVSGMTLLNAIASAGGFDDYADKKKVTVTRFNGKIETINCVKALTDPRLDIAIYPKDKIDVPMRKW